MQYKRYIKSCLALLSAVAVLATASGCNKTNTSSGKTTGNGSSNTSSGSTLLDGVDYDKAYGKFDEPVTITLGVWQRDTEASYDDNAFLDFLREEFNINVEFEWILPWEQHVEKVNMSINAGTLPDAVTIYSNQQVNQLLENNSILDLSKYKEYFGNFLAAAYSSFDNNSCLEEVTVDGKLGALPSTAVGYQHELLWIRNDWLEAVGLDVPKTLDDVINVAKAFVSQDPDQNGKDDTFGIPFSSYAYGVDNQGPSLDPIFAAMGSYPGAWIKGSDGKAVYGSTTEETKNALAKLSELFSSKVVFCSEDNNGVNIGNGKCGLYFGPWWSGGTLKASFDANPDADWIAVSAPLDSEGKYNIPQQKAALDVNGHLIFSPNCEHPEAVIKMINIFHELSCTDSALPKETVEKYQELKKNSSKEVVFPIFQQIAAKDSIIEENQKLLDAVKSGDKSELSAVQLTQYDTLKKFDEDIYSCTADEWCDAVNFTVGIPAANSKALNVVPVVATVLPTEYTSTYTKIEAMEDQYFYEIISGIKTVDAFDNFVSNFKSMGGNDILTYIDSK